MTQRKLNETFDKLLNNIKYYFIEEDNLIKTIVLIKNEELEIAVREKSKQQITEGLDFHDIMCSGSLNSTDAIILCSHLNFIDENYKSIS